MVSPAMTWSATWLVARTSVRRDSGGGQFLRIESYQQEPKKAARRSQPAGDAKLLALLPTGLSPWKVARQVARRLVAGFAFQAAEDERRAILLGHTTQFFVENCLKIPCGYFRRGSDGVLGRTLPSWALRRAAASALSR